MKKTEDEEKVIFENIENVSHDLKNQVGELQKFIKELKSFRYDRPRRTQDDEGGAQYG